MHVQLVQKLWFPEPLGFGSSTWEVIWGWGVGVGASEQRVCTPGWLRPQGGSPGPCFLFQLAYLVTAAATPSGPA